MFIAKCKERPNTAQGMLTEINNKFFIKQKEVKTVVKKPIILGIRSQKINLCAKADLVFSNRNIRRMSP